ncbi:MULTISPECIES: hypothetical protein [Rhizobium]|uniref:Uncharacterized protein n=1 Tax=Rhizobium miluonense TaxID=411945 RepID=A0ABU1SIY5_9HYPH|nr:MULTISPECIES: hypothetical protein [Rhizobium]MBB3424794.1 hypothetical protein [Rhizobium sp. BK312]MDR6898949.1 hypothetical protein [Rhizobium miluonense]
MRQKNIVLASKVIKESPAGNPGRCGNLVDRRFLIAFREKGFHSDVRYALKGQAALLFAQPFRLWGYIMHRAILA